MQSLNPEKKPNLYGNVKKCSMQVGLHELLCGWYYDIILSELTIKLGDLNIIFNLNYRR